MAHKTGLATPKDPTEVAVPVVWLTVYKMLLPSMPYKTLVDENPMSCSEFVVPPPKPVGSTLVIAVAADLVVSIVPTLPLESENQRMSAAAWLVVKVTPTKATKTQCHIERFINHLS